MKDFSEGTLIIQRYNFLTEPTFQIGDWLSGLHENSPLYLLTSCRQEHVDKKLYKEVHYVDTDPESLLPAVTKLLADNDISNIVTHYETDFIAAATARESFKLRGQTVQSAEAFRDKAIMKRLCEEAQIRVPKFKAFTKSEGLASTTASVLQYFDLPVVVKPIDGLGSAATFLVHTESELQYGISESDNTFLVEELIEGDLYHVDGIVENDEVLFNCSSKYFGTTLNFLEGKAVGSHILVQSSELSQRLKRFSNRVLSALPKPEKLTFNCEMFITPANEIIFGEIASRPPGALVPQVINHVYGFNINKIHIGQQVGISFNSISKADEQTAYAAWLTFPPLEGTLTIIDPQIPKDLGVQEVYENFCEGKKYSRGASVGDYILGAVIKADSYQKLLENVTKLENWYSQSFVFDNYLLRKTIAEMP